MQIASAALDLIDPDVTILEEFCRRVCHVEILCLQMSEDGALRTPLKRLSKSVVAMWEMVSAKREEHGLTWAETARIVHHLSNSWLHCIVQVERHGPESDKKADEA